MTIEQWIQKYEKRAEKFDVPPGYKIFYDTDKGFMLWRVYDEAIEIDHCCTNDINYMIRVAEQKARENGVNLIRTMTYKNPAAYLRLTKSHLDIGRSHVLANGLFYWCFEKGVTNVI